MSEASLVGDSEQVSSNFSVQDSFGIKLHINESPRRIDFTAITAIDVETDEKDRIVGVGLCQSESDVWFFEQTPSELGLFTRLIGHGIKSDLHWLRKDTFNLDVKNIFADTMIMSYTINPTAESHGLKSLGKDLLQMRWPSYRDMVGQGRTKVTLDHQPVDKVANYNGADTLATFRLYHLLRRQMTPMHYRMFNQIEMPIMRLLYTMEKHGLLIDVNFLDQLRSQFSKECHEYEEKLAEIAKDLPDFNPRSPKQVIELCHKLGMRPVDRNLKTHKIQASSSKKALMPFVSHPFVSTLFEHRQVSKLLSTYIERPSRETTLPLVHPTFSQVSVDTATDSYHGIRTGRLSSDYHNIPRRSERGKLLRKMFIAPPDYSIICGDYSQIEYRLLAHLTQEPLLLDAFRSHKDVHEETAKAFGSTDREVGKTLNFASIYGSQEDKIVWILAQCRPPIIKTKEEVTKLMSLYWERLPKVGQWIARKKFEAKAHGGVRTILGRFIPVPLLSSSNYWEKLHAERQAINYIIQGSAADIIKLAMLKCAKVGYLPILQVHDELLFLTRTKTEKENTEEVQKLMESIITLDVPLEADIGYGKNWAEAKG